MLVVTSLIVAIFTRRDHRLHTLPPGLLNDRVAVIAFVSQQVLGVNALNQYASLRAIRAGTFCNNNSERHTVRIHGQMYLGVEPPFVRLMA